MRIAVGADHAGYALKELLVPWLRASGHEVDDLGAVCRHLRVLDRLSLPQDLTGVNGVEKGQGSQNEALTGAGGTDQDRAIPPVELQIDPSIEPISGGVGMEPADPVSRQQR